MIASKRILLLIVSVLISSLTLSHEAKCEIPLKINETAGIDRTGEMVHNGIPVAKRDNITSTENLVIEDSNGIQVPATFEVLSRWAGGKDDVASPIQWLLVSFPATVSAGGTADYFLRTGTPVARTDRVTVTESPSDYSVDTGAAQFVINKNACTLFDSIAQGGQMLASGNGGSHSTIAGQAEAEADTPLQVVIERLNDHYAVIKVEGDYENTPIGSSPNLAPISYKIRYEFFAGSPTVTVNHKFFWAGSGDDSSDGRPSGNYYFTMDNVSLTLPDTPNHISTDVYADQTTYLTGSTPQPASIAQRRKTLYLDPHLAELTNGSDSANTEFASRPMLISRSSDGAIAVSIDHMKYFEPQSITTDNSGKIKVSVMAEPQYFADYQGTWARVGISALPQDATYEDSVRLNFAPLNYRLFAFPPSSYTATTGVYNEIVATPESTCPGAITADTPAEQKIQCYYEELSEVTDATRAYLEDLDKDDYRGVTDFRGLMTWGSIAGYPDNMGSLDSWDRIYSGAWNTDYHNGWHNVNYQFILEGDPIILYDLAFMAARRMLHTQIIQPDWANSSSFMGWGYTGYHRYRSDGVSSHSFFENLFNYYYLTGDLEVLDTLRAGGENRRDLYTRENGNLNDIITYDPSGRAAEHQGRIGAQAIRIFNFLGHIDNIDSHQSDSMSFLQDYHHMFRHVFARSMFLQQSTETDTPDYAFLGDDIVSPNTFTSGTEAEQNWMVAIYTLNDLYRYYVEWDDPLVINLRNDVDTGLNDRDLRVSVVYQALVNSLMRYVPNACVSGTVCYRNPGDGNGEWNTRWPNKFQVNYTGHRLNGSIESVVPVVDGDDQLFDPGKTLLTLVYLRAGKMFGDAFDFEGDGLDDNDSYTTFGLKGLNRSLMDDDFYEAEEQFWAKVNAEVFGNLHSSVSYLQSLSITTDNLPEAIQETQYSSQLQAIQGSPPYTWTVIAGTLPEGVNLAEDGTLSGIPATDGTFNFTVRVSDADSSTDTASFVLTVYSNELTITTTSLPSVEEGIYYSQILRTINGVPPYSWTVTQGSLPLGLHLSGSGTISGIPTTQGTFNFTAQVTDGESAVDTAGLSITVTPLAPHEIEVRVAQASDDAEEAITGVVFLNSDLEIGQDGGYDQDLGIRFSNLDMPKDVEIANAYIQFTVEETVNTDPVNITIYGENTGNSQTFLAENDNITSRQLTTNSVTWQNIVPWTTTGESGENQRTPDLSSIIQEIVDREDWAADNSLSFIINGTGTRVAYSYDGNPQFAPLLHLEYTQIRSVEPGDVNGNTTVDLEDAVLALQVASGEAPAGITVGGDANGDGLGIAEAIMALRKTSGLATE